MDIRKQLLKGHTRAGTTKIVQYVGNSSARFKLLIEVFLAGPYRVTQRAAWPVSLCVEQHPGLIKPHLKSLLDYLKKPGLHDAVKRNVLRLLQFIEIPKRNQAQVANMCYEYFRDKKEPVAIRVFAMTVLANLTAEIPDLKEELVWMIEDELPFASAGFRARARAILKTMQRKFPVPGKGA